MSNETFMRNLLNRFPNLNGLNFKNNILYYNQESVKLDNIHLDSFFKKNINLTHNLSALTSEEVYKIIACHCNYTIKEKNYLNLDENIIIKGFRVIKHENENGLINDYVYIIDEQEKTYIDTCDYAKEAFSFYKDNNQNHYSQVTVQMINNYLKQFNNQIDINQEILDLYPIRDYLLSPIKEKLDYYLKKMTELELKEDKNIEEQNNLNKYHEIIKETERKKIRTLKINAGYFDGFIIIGLVSLLGIILSILLVKGLK